MSEEEAKGHEDVVPLLDHFLGKQEADHFRAGRARRAEQESARWRAAANQLAMPMPMPTPSAPASPRPVTAAEIAAAIRRDPITVRQTLLDLILPDIAVLIAHLTRPEGNHHA
jgi:hypothetical protein